MAEPFNIFTSAAEIEPPPPVAVRPASAVPPGAGPYEPEVEPSGENAERRFSSEREPARDLGFPRVLALGALAIVAIVLAAALFGAAGEGAQTGELRDRAQARPDARGQQDVRASLAALRSDQTRLWSAWRRLERRLTRASQLARQARSEAARTSEAPRPVAGDGPEPPVVGSTPTLTSQPAQIPSPQTEFGFER